jgi:hypothetical protein
MIVQYGNYVHGQNEVALTITSEELRTASEILYGFRQRYTLTAFPGVEAPTQTSLTNEINSLINAYSIDGQDLLFYLDDGVTLTAHCLFNANTLGGTHVKPPSFPNGQGAEYSTYRSYTIEVWGDVPLTGNNLLLEYEETLEAQGNGGPTRVFLHVAQGPPVWQQTTQLSVYRVTQTGSAKGLYAYPQPNPPLWPGNVVSEQMRISFRTPRLRRNQYYEYPVSWSYPMEANLALTGLPNLQPIQSP